MNTKSALLELNTRFDAFEEHLAKLGVDVSTITAIFYNYINSQVYYTNTLGWQPVALSGLRPSYMEELVTANIKAWKKTLLTEDMKTEA